jgi:putative serine protease PepD
VAPEVAAPPPPPAGKFPWDSPTASPELEPPKPKRPSKLVALVVAVALAASGLGAGATYLVLSGDLAQDPAVATSAVRIGAESVAAALLPSIVKVETRAPGAVGIGSGVIYSSDGYIITNDHVVEGAATVSVQLHTGEVVPAEVVGSAAPSLDIAVLKIDRDRLRAAKFGSSDDLKLGELAVAIGNPLGLEASVSAGVVSGLHRNGAVGGTRFIDAIQTDAPLQPGNSGGALANSDGEVIGINTLVVGQRNAGTAMGLAISSEAVKSVADQIIKSGSARLAFIGIEGDDAGDGEGVAVLAVSPGGPAEQAGLRAGDVVRSIDGDRINSMDQLVSALIQRDVGDQVSLQVERNGAPRTLRVRLQAREG